MGIRAKSPQILARISPFHLARCFSVPPRFFSFRYLAPTSITATTANRAIIRSACVWLFGPPFFIPSSPTTASPAHHQYTHNLSPLAAKDDNYPSSTRHDTAPDDSLEQISTYIAVPPLLHHSPQQGHAHGRQEFPQPSRSFFPTLRSDRNPNEISNIRGNCSQSRFRLLNPINYVPRIAVVATHEVLASNEDITLATSDRDAYPLLQLPTQRPQLQPASPNSLIVERSIGDVESKRTSIALPSSRRRSQPPEASEQSNMPGDETSRNGGHIRPDDGITQPPRHAQSNNSLRNSTYATYPAGGDNNNSNTDGREGDASEEVAWGPAHPCYPHMNPHVPLQSEEFTTTRIIRIRRDWMVKGDLAPTFSNLYPEILRPTLPEQEFRRIIAKINGELVKAFDPFSLRNWFDSAMGLVTGWLWDDMGFAGIKSHLARIEDWLEKWNREVGSKDGVQIWSLRRTAYMALDIQIPDPKVGLVNPEEASVPGTRPETGRIETPTTPAKSHV